MAATVYAVCNQKFYSGARSGDYGKTVAFQADKKKIKKESKMWT